MRREVHVTVEDGRVMHRGKQVGVVEHGMLKFTKRLKTWVDRLLNRKVEVYVEYTIYTG